MPASDKYTLIKLMRGDSTASRSWIPEEGEPLYDMDTRTLTFGDGQTTGGLPINTNTCIQLQSPCNLDTCKTWGNFFIAGIVSPLPSGIQTPCRVFLDVKMVKLGSLEIWQTLQILDGEYALKTYQRVSLDGGIVWSSWNDTNSSNNWDNPTGTGTTPGDSNLDNYTNSSQAFVENITNGPNGTDGESGFLITYRANPNSPYIFQQLIIAGTSSNAGKWYYRYSVASNTNWNNPGYTWRELTDYVTKDLSNATGVLPHQNGGTGRTDGTVAQADYAKTASYK